MSNVALLLAGRNSPSITRGVKGTSSDMSTRWARWVGNSDAELLWISNLNSKMNGVRGEDSPPHSRWPTYYMRISDRSRWNSVVSLPE